MDAEQIFAGLNDEQRAAVEATHGPVCILAGAGTGKTTTITRRIAWQVASGAFAPADVVAVTFTDKAAGRAAGAACGARGRRRARVDVPLGGARAAAALRGRPGADPLDEGAAAPPDRQPAAAAVQVPARGRPRHRGRVGEEPPADAGDVPRGLGGHEPPIPADLAHRVFREYERRKEEAGALDFEDLLERTIRMLEDDDAALALVRERWHAFTVDEYQDVNLLQQTLLELWLGERDELCAVGDDYQSIYGFTGASAQWLLALPRRFPHAKVVRLEQNYRSTPQVLALANRLVPQLGGAEKTLRATRDDGPEPVVRAGADVAARDRESSRRRRGVRGAGGARAHERARGRLRGGAARRAASRFRAPRCSRATRRGGC